jgi:hypothetical protein
MLKDFKTKQSKKKYNIESKKQKLKKVFKSKLNSGELVSIEEDLDSQNYNEREDRKFNGVDIEDNDEVHGLDDNHP